MVKNRIAIIGPMSPWRGGISQYTTQLLGSLQKSGDVKAISFKTLYPRLLYPGENDKDPNMKKRKDIDYRLSIYNPSSLFLTAAELKKQGCQVAYIDWWTLIWQPWIAVLSWRLRKKGITTVFICHNVFDHDANSFIKKISGFFLRQADGYIVHSSEQARFLKEFNPAAKIHNSILPIYTHYPKPKKKLKKRGKLELLYFGFIRPYKGVDVLIDAMKAIQSDEEIYLTIVGEYWGDAGEFAEKIKQANIPNVEYVLRYVDDSEASMYFDRADIVVLPYISATGSAVVSLAYGRGKPVIATRVGGLKDAVIEGSTGWLVNPSDPDELLSSIRHADRNSASKLAPKIADFCAQNSWDNLAESMYNTFK